MTKYFLVFSIFILMCSSLLGLGKKDETNQIIDSLKDNGFVDSCSYTGDGSNISPCLFMDKYTFIERCGEYIISRNIQNSEERKLIKIENTPAYTNVYSINNDLLYYSIVRENNIKLCSFSFITEENILLYETYINNTTRDGFINVWYSWFDMSENLFYIIDTLNQDGETECAICNLNTAEKLIIPIDNSWMLLDCTNDSYSLIVKNCNNSSEYALFNPGTKEISKSVQFPSNTVALRSYVQYSDNYVYAVNREYRTVSDIYKINFSNEYIEPILKNFPYGIKGIWCIPDGGFCFLVYGNNNMSSNYVFCYFE